MKMSDLSKDELAIVESSAHVSDTIMDYIEKKVKEASTWQKILHITRDFMIKNGSKLNTNIMGRQVLVNAKMESDILDAFGINSDMVRTAILESPYFKLYGKELSMTAQYCLGFPLILAAQAYRRLKKIEESKLCYLLAFYKPYASRESVLFKYGVKEGQMEYTLQHLSKRFDLKNCSTIGQVLAKRSEISYNNYFENQDEKRDITDKELHVIYNSGIASRVNDFINKMFEEYTKNNGKSLDFEDGIKGLMDKDSDAMEYSDNDIESDTAVKRRIVDSAIAKVTKVPVDTSLVVMAAQYGFESKNQMYVDILTSTITDIVDKMFDKLDLFFSSLIGAFLFRINPKTGGRYGIQDMSSNFLAVGNDILAGKKSNIKEKDLLTARTIFKEMLEDHSVDYVARGDTFKRQMGKALAFYWVGIVRKCK